VHPDTALISLSPRSETPHISSGWTVLVTGRDGFVADAPEQGLFVHETRMLSRLRYRVHGVEPLPVALSGIAQHAWLGYYICRAHAEEHASGDHGSGMMALESEYTLELRIAREVAGGLRETLLVTNYTQEPVRAALEIELDGDFADIQETNGDRRQIGDLTKSWRQRGPDTWELTFQYEASADDSEAHPVKRCLTIRFAACSTAPTYEDGTIRFEVHLEPRESWSGTVHFIPEVEPLAVLDRSIDDAGGDPDAAIQRARTRDRRVEEDLATVSSPQDGSLATTVLQTFRRASGDLQAMRLPGLGTGDDGWTMAAGLPIYAALYGRDVLTASWQAAMLGPDMMRGSLSVLAAFQGTCVDDWRDEQPGRMLHEMHTGPLKVLNENPFGRYYGSATTSAFYPVVAAELWHWTGDRDQAFRFLDAALRAIEWLDSYGDTNGDGFYDYKTRSPMGTKHQAWKDSPDAMVGADGHSVEPPIATCEEQGFVYLAKLHTAEVLWWLGNRDEARRLYDDAESLKKRFNEAFWMEEEGFYAMGLDADGNQIRPISSNPGHALATSIIDAERASRVADRLFEPDLFSGWGVRTLSTKNPAYNPYSYHRGSVWPVEQATFALAFMRYGLWDHLHRLARAQFEAAARFQHFRLPEVFSGHAWTEQQPFPAFYPKANVPQAWSASSVICMIQAMLGLYPYAPLKLLVVDPHLPDWLPELRIERLRVGHARVTIRFFRRSDGTTDYHIEDLEGTLHVVRQPSPWSLSAGWVERGVDALRSLLPGK
jgi:glycogen debranching enzyme